MNLFCIDTQQLSHTGQVAALIVNRELKLYLYLTLLQNKCCQPNIKDRRKGTNNMY